MSEILYTRRGIVRPYIDRADDINGEWDLFNRPFNSYRQEFIDAGFGYVVDQVVDGLRRIPRPVVVDLMAPPYTLKGLRKHLGDKNMRALAVGRYDHRTHKEKLQDEIDGVEYIAGDIQDPATQDDVRTTLHPDYANFVMSVGWGGLEYLRTTARDYAGVAEMTWDILHPEGGTALLQMPPRKSLQANGVDIDGWTNSLDQAGVVYKYQPTYRKYESFGMLHLQRIPDVEFPRFARRTTNKLA
jgi:hypothetical protein